jgi:16S rRNA processing protein RimM
MKRKRCGTLDDYFQIGIVLKPQGLKGELRVFPTTDDPDRFGLLDEVFICLDNKAETYKIESARHHKNLVYLRLTGIHSREAAAGLTGGLLKIPPEKALPLEENEYYIRDLLGLTVRTDTGEELGILRDVRPTGANDVYIIKTPEDEIMVPAVKEYVLSVSIPDKSMVIKLPVYS